MAEDENDPADELDRALREAGASVLGPVPSVGTAPALVAGGPPEAVVLNVNLGGEMAPPRGRRHQVT